MTIAEGSGKGHGDENFPVASFLIAARHRPAIMAFYDVARMADDVADHPSLAPEEKLAQLALIEAGVKGRDDRVPAASRLASVLAQRDLPDAHILDLLEAFRRDAVKARYAGWDELMDYCRYSAAPVGRYVLDVHGESRATWPASDALCAALQVINHLQDCGKDARAIDRIYVPADALAAEGLNETALLAPAASPGLRRVIVGLAQRTQGLLAASRALAPAVVDTRLATEIGVIQSLAERLVRRLLTHDPLSQRVHLDPLETLAGATHGVLRALTRRPGRAQAPTRSAELV